MKRIIVTVLLLAMLLCGCGSGAGVYVPTGDGLYQDQTTQSTSANIGTKLQNMTLAYYPDKSLNPYESADNAHRLIFSLVYQGLFTVDSAYSVSPVLCKNYTVSKDMRTYVFYPAAATFANGSPVTARDIAASLETARTSQVYSGRLKQISAISVTDDGGVEVSLQIPYEDLPILLDVPIVAADEVAAERPMGSGPYGYEMGPAGLRLKRRANWWCRAELIVTADHVSLLKVDSPATMRDDFEYDNISIVCADPGSDAYVDYRCDYELWDVESGIFLYLTYNKNSAVFSNKTLRAALTHAIDRDALIRDYYRGFATAAYMPASPDSPRYDTTAEEKYGYDGEKFSQILADAGLESLAITLLVNKADSRRVKVARGVAEMLESYGFIVTVSALSGTSYTNALKNRKFDLHLAQTKLSANMDLSAFFDPDGALSVGGMADTAAFALAQGAMENEGNFTHLYKRIMDNGLMCPLLFRTYAIYVRRGLFDDMTPARDHIFYYDLGRTMESAKLQ